MPGSMPISLSAGGGTSGSSSNAGVALPINTPFNFDGSGWVINFGDGNSSSATGNKDANASQQTPSAGGSSGLLGGLSTSTVLLAVAAYFLLAD
jgi:hypothetical protein